MKEDYFSWPDYVVLVVMLSLSTAIGFYYACTGGKQRTTKEYLLADRSMSWLPVACSLLASFVSSQTLMGLPGEIYAYGTIFMFGYLFSPFGVLMGAAFYLPVFEQIQCVSVYKYIELRYGKTLKYLSLAFGLIQLMLYSALVIYGPALSISAVTGINVWLAVLSVILVAALYTVVGGMKAVLWTDTLQLTVMFGGVFLVLIMGIAEQGGIGEVWRVNKLSGRLDILDPTKFTDFDPRARHTIWSVLTNMFLSNVTAFGTSQVSVQRAMSLRSSKDFKIAYGLTALGTSLFGILCGLLGIVIFSHYKLCDPIEDGQIFSKDQLYPLYVMRLLDHLPGLPGLILSSILSASLSTISSTLNSGATILLQDFVRPFRPNLSEKHATLISKVLSLGFGVFALILVLFARYFGTGILSMGITFAGILGGPTIAIFTMGIFLPIVNEKGAVIGMIVGGAYSAWIGFGSLISQPYIYKYPTTTIGCNVTDVHLLANMSSPVYDPSTWDPQSHYRGGVSAMYDISYCWASAGGLLLTTIISVAFSLLLAKKYDPTISKKLLSPYVLKSCCIMPRSWKDKIDFDDNNLVLKIFPDTSTNNVSEGVTAEYNGMEINFSTKL